MAQEKQGWDTRAWRSGLIGCALFGVMYVVGAFKESHSHTAHGGLRPVMDVYYLLGATATLAMNFLLPGILAGVSRRVFLLWGLAPPLALGALALVTRYLKNDVVALNRDIHVIPVYILLSCLLVSGPISLTRWLRARALRRRETVQALIRAQQEAAAVPREGVWPPPPDYRP